MRGLRGLRPTRRRPPRWWAGRIGRGGSRARGGPWPTRRRLLPRRLAATRARNCETQSCAPCCAPRRRASRRTRCSLRCWPACARGGAPRRPAPPLIPGAGLGRATDTRRASRTHTDRAELLLFLDPRRFDSPPGQPSMAHVKAQSALMDGKRYWPGEGVVPKYPNGCQALHPPLPARTPKDTPPSVSNFTLPAPVQPGATLTTFAQCVAAARVPNLAPCVLAARRIAASSRRRRASCWPACSTAAAARTPRRWPSSRAAASPPRSRHAHRAPRARTAAWRALYARDRSVYGRDTARPGLALAEPIAVPRAPRVSATVAQLLASLCTARARHSPPFWRCSSP